MAFSCLVSSIFHLLTKFPSEMAANLFQTKEFVLAEHLLHWMLVDKIDLQIFTLLLTPPQSLCCCIMFLVIFSCLSTHTHTSGSKYCFNVFSPQVQSVIIAEFQRIKTMSRYTFEKTNCIILFHMDATNAQKCSKHLNWREPSQWGVKGTTLIAIKKKLVWTLDIIL